MLSRNRTKIGRVVSYILHISSRIHQVVVRWSAVALALVGRPWRRALKQHRRRQAYRKLKQLGLIDAFSGYPADAIAPKYHELYGLYRLVKKRKPAVLVELGGGYSTFAFAQACHDLAAKQGHRVQFYSVDQSDYWQQVVKERMPPKLSPFVNFYRATPRLIEIHGTVVSAFDSLPAKYVNLIFVDGGTVPGNRIGVDALQLEKSAPADYAILVDGRKETVVFLREHLTRQYRIGPGLGGTQTLFQPAS
jgi:hypothetical protein